MLRYATISLLFIFIGTHPASAQQWAKKMFKVTKHDFGTVPRAAKAEFAFELTNLYVQDVRIAGVRTSCGCTTPRVSKRTLKTHEKGAIIAKFNTRSFLGQRRATITVILDRPQYAEVQLAIAGYVRRDVVLDPGFVNFGAVDHGSTAERRVRVEYAGRNDWKIVDIHSQNEHLECETNEKHRGGNRAGYDLLLRLKDDAPVGYLKEQVLLVTNDRRLPKLQLLVDGRVVCPLTVSPALLSFGVVQPGQQATKTLVVRGENPLAIVDLQSTDRRITFAKPEDRKALHLIPVTFTAGDQPGKITETIEVQTDMEGGAVSRVQVLATVVEP